MQHHSVASETRGKKKRIRFHRQTGHFPSMQGSACCLRNTHGRLDHSHSEGWLPDRHPKRWVQVRHYRAPNILHECVRLQTLRLIPFFVHDGMDIDEMDAGGLTALHVASKTLRKEAIQMLLHCGANVNLTAPMTGRSALHFATQSSSSKGGITLAAGEECIELLLRNGAQVCMRDRSGKAAIHFACQGGRNDLVTLLLDYGADINSLTNLQESPLFLFLKEKTNLRQAHLLDKLLGLSYPLKITNAENCLPTGLIFPCAGRLKDTLLSMTSNVLPLQEICKFNIRKIYRGNMKLRMETKLPADLWKSIYIDQEFSYASKIKAFNEHALAHSGPPR
ncbi:UNVERIFIED_CONTAM: hypothetical protein K2H54_026952 [Gekko kuhli]